MKRVDVISRIEERAEVSKDVIRRVLLALSVVIGGELQANEPVELPHLGRLVPMDKPVRGNKRVRVTTFEPNAALKKKLAYPLARMRLVHSD